MRKICLFFVGIGLSILCEECLDLCDDLGSALNNVGNLLDGAALVFHTNVDHINVTVGRNNEETNGNNGKTCASSAAEVLKACANSLLALAGIVKTTRSTAERDLRYGNDGGSLRGVDGITDNGVCGPGPPSCTPPRLRRPLPPQPSDRRCAAWG